jgi:hypothetical protein
MPTYADCGGRVISTISGWFEVIAEQGSKADQILSPLPE